MRNPLRRLGARYRMWRLRRLLAGWRCSSPRCGQRQDYGHGACVTCDAWTCDREMVVDPGTLRRRFEYVCAGCELPVRYAKARTARAVRDFRQITERNPVELLPILRPQYPGLAREAVRAFLAGDDPFATVTGTDTATLNESIRTLGLDDRVFAEQRGNTTVLRRVATAEAARGR